MKSFPPLFRPFVSAVALWVVPFLLLGISPLLADVFDHSGTAGDFQDGHWFNQTATPPGGPNIYGNPGPGDDAYFYASTISASGGSVHLLSGDHLSLSGTLTAVNVGIIGALSGDGTLDVQALVTDANGFAGVNIEGGHLKAQNGNGVGSVAAGGTVTDATCSGTNGCGLYDEGSSLTITGLGGPGQANFFNGSTLTANGGLTDFGLNFQSGSTGHVSSINNGIATVNGTGSTLMVTGDFSLNSQSVTASAGGVVTISGTLTQNSGAPVSVAGSGSALTTGQFSSMNGGDLNITTGGVVTVQGTLTRDRGQVFLDGSNSALTVFQDFSLMAGFLDISTGGALSVNGQLTLDGNGGGHWQGANTTIQSNGVMFLGSTTGSFSLGIDNGATVETASALLGRQQGSTGNVDLSGAGTLWHVQAIGLTVGRTGRGTFDISDNAHLLLDTGTVFAIGFDSGSNGNMTLDGNGSVIDATGALVSVGKSDGSVGSLVLTNQASLLLGENTFVGDGGNGTLSVSSGSHVTLSGDLTRFGVGNQAGSTGSVSVQGTDSLLTVTGPMIVGVGGNGFLGVSQGGKIVLTNTVGLKIGELPSAHGTLVVDGAQTSLDVASFLAVGDGGIGQATISGGGEINATGSKVDVGGPVGSTGSITITGQDSSLSVETGFGMTVGGGGTGSVIVADDAQVLINRNLEIAVRNGSTGSLSISDAGTLLYASAIIFGDIPIPGQPVDGGAGTITVQNGGRLRVQETIDIRSSTANPSVTIANGQIGVGTGDFGPAGSLRVSENGVLIGNPRGIQGQVIIGLGGRISPGNSPGTIAIDGGYQQDAGSTFLAEIGGADPGTGYDQITATGTASFGGNLTVRLINGFTPTVGQTFRIVNAASASGAFDSISEPSQAGISLTSDTTGVTVTIVSVVAGAPVINSATTTNAGPGAPFSYQIAATNNPTSFGATNLPPGLTVDNSTGLISGTPVNPGTFIVPINANNAAGSGQADLTLILAPIFVGPVLPPSDLLNISTRMRVQAGDNALIGGFIVTGTDPKKVIIRGIGPSLSSFFSGALADPTLELFQGSTLLVSNDNWKTDQQAEIEATGIPPTNDLESAIVRTLTPGSYTAVLRGKDNTTGIGVVEAYDLDQAANSTLANISTRGFVETGDNVMIGGLIVGPPNGANATMVVRAIGPTLGNFGISGALQDPTLDLVNSDGVVIRSNNDWRESQESQIIAARLAPSDDRESALIETLAPGSYTAIVRGAGGTTGVGLVEAYHLE
jgi:T5SS/PEP-CTERM-associated repeat protein